MKANQVPTVFLSAATDELEALRNVLHGAFSRAGFRVFTQKHSLSAAPGTLRDFLVDHVRQSKCIIHLAGMAYGSDADEPFPEAPDFQCSWTQFEYYFAHQQGKKVIAFVCAPDLSRRDFAETGTAAADIVRKQRLQQEHRQRVASGEFTGTPLAGCVKRTLNEAVISWEQLLQAIAASVASVQGLVGNLSFDPRLHTLPERPIGFIGREADLARLRQQNGAGGTVLTGLRGMGGIGKTALAAALARNRQVRQAYPDGVVWIAAGQKLTDDDLLKRQRDLARHLGGDDTFASLAQGQGVLRPLLAAKAVLLVLDDVWRAADAQAFDVLGPRCRMLVTTRDKSILDALHGELVPVSLFTEPEALQLLADAVNVAPAALPAEAREVARECGLLPLALALCGGMARKRGGDFHSVLERLRRADLEKIADRESINEQHRSIWRAMQASVEMLPDDEQQRFAELSVFATDQTVPESASSSRRKPVCCCCIGTPITTRT